MPDPVYLLDRARKNSITFKERGRACMGPSKRRVPMATRPSTGELLSVISGHFRVR